MEHARNLIPQQPRESAPLTNNGKPNREESQESLTNHERMIRRFWARMNALYPHKWASAVGDEDDGTWTRALFGLTGQHIAKGLEQCLVRQAEGNQWPPNPGEFRAMCDNRPAPRLEQPETPRPTYASDDWLELSHEAYQRKHDLYKRPDETSRQFARRCMATCGIDLKEDGTFDPPDLSMDRKR